MGINYQTFGAHPQTCMNKICLLGGKHGAAGPPACRKNLQGFRNKLQERVHKMNISETRMATPQSWY